MAIYYAVASQRDFERNLNLGSDSSLDEIIMSPESDLAGVHAPTVSGSGDSSHGWCRSSYSCPVHNSLLTTTTPPPRVNNHHRNCPRAHLHQNPSTIMTPSSDSSSNHATPPEDDEPDKPMTRWASIFPHLAVSGVTTKTAELGYRALWSVISDFLPWIVGSYVIFQAFKYGMLELGLAAFLLMLSVHGVLKWCNARGRDKREEELADYETDAQVDIQCREDHHHHLHHQDHDLSDTDFSSSDDSDLEDDPPSIGKVVIVIDEPPPSYDAVSRATTLDLDLDLQVHLTPRHPKGEHKSTPGFSENVYAEETKEQGTSELARPAFVSYTSCMSSEMEDDSLPSYSDAVKKIKRKKKRNLRTRARRLENGCPTEEETLIRSLNYKDAAKISNIESTVPGETPADPQNESGSMNCSPTCSALMQETVQENASTLPSRELLGDMNAMLDVDAPYSSFPPSRGPYM